ncbi:Peptidase M56, BlaR1 (modular protein) [Candidatus Sulfopaludibacter sp. SbA3]|nr:Peptidase M56, BlaR1 (modular protein) [Candidatus Sulfopaludibacter sp. SbA3]
MTTIQFLAEWTIRSLILILAGAVLLWLLRVKNPALRLTAWTAMLGASIAIPALMTALPGLPMAVLRAPARAPMAASAMVSGEDAIEFAGPAADLSPGPVTGRTAAAKAFDWARLAATVYALVAGALLLRLFTGWIVSLRILRRSRDSGVVEDGIGIRESRHVLSPVTVGIIRSAILLPPDWRAWDSAKLSAVLAHERSHIRRRDPVVQFVSAIHRALLWASPASWLLHRSIVRAAEEVSDDDAVAAACDRVLYAEILLDFIQRGVGPASWPRVAMAHYDRPATRIWRILNSNAAPRGLTRLGIAAIVMLGVPLAYLAAAAYPQRAAQPPRVAMPATPAPAAAEPPSGAALAPAPAPPAAAERPQAPPAHESTAAQLPQFEVASVKRTDPSVMHMMGARVYPGGRLEIFGVNLKSLVATAFGLANWQVSGGEAWTEKENYDIEAKPPESLQSSIKSLRYSWYEIRDKQLRAMLQSLLISRFQLQFHHETRTGDVYLLEQSGKTLRLHPVEIPSAADDPESSRGFESVGYAGGQWDITDAGMPYLAKFASSFIFHVPILDRTGLTGQYHYRQAVPDAEPKYGGDQSDSFRSFLAEMGLKMERTKGPVETIVIDHAATPSPN